MKIFNFFLVGFLTTSAFAQDLSKSFPAGKGSTFKLVMQDGPPIDLSIYVASSTSGAVNVEYYMNATGSLVPVQMWQQFEVKISRGKADIQKGYLKTKELRAPQIIPSEYLKGYDGVQVNDFLFSSEAELDKNKIGVDEVDIPAGKTKANHYRTINNNQTIDYWISDDAKPIGLVKLVSTSLKDPKKNYKIELKSLMENVRATIDPSLAGPLTDVGRAFLAKPESVR